MPKVCKTCKRDLPSESFNKHTTSRDRLRPDCRDCTKAHHAKWRAANQAKVLELRKAYYAKKGDDIRSKSIAYRKGNLDLVKQKEKEYRQRYKEPLKARKQSDYQKHKHKYVDKYKAYRQSHPEYARMSCHKRKARFRNAPGTYTRTQFLAKCDYHGWRCYLCKTPLVIKELHFDHRKPLAKGGTNWVANLAPACGPCNLAKGHKTEAEYRQIILPNCPRVSADARDVTSYASRLSGV